MSSRNAKQRCGRKFRLCQKKGSSFTVGNGNKFAYIAWHLIPKTMTVRLICCVGCVLCCVLLSCSKSPSSAAPTNPIPPANPNPPTTTAKTITMNLDLVIDGQQTGKYTFEFIVTEPGGQSLLDTIMNTNGPLIATIHPTDSMVDVTTIVKDSADFLTAIVYKGVNPAAWKNSVPEPVVQISYPLETGHSAHVYFTNLPPAPFPSADHAGDFAFFDYTWSAGAVDGYDTAFNTFYSHYDNAWAYVLLPYDGLYSLYKPIGYLDTINLSTMDTAVMISLSLPAGFTLSPSAANYPTMLMGILDTTDLSQSVQLGPTTYATLYNAPNSYFLIPKTPIQKYETQVAGRNSVGDVEYFYNYGNSVPASPGFLDPNSFTLGSDRSDSFAISFSGARPTFYTTGWGIANFSLYICSSSDSNVVHPQTFLNKLKSKLLSGVPFSDLQYGDLELGSIAGYTYGSFLNYASDPRPGASQRVSSASILIRNYN
jgi:hypothetical protein